MSEPVILVVDDDPQVLAAIRRDLKDRYQADYRILATASGESAMETLAELKRRGDAVALVVSDQRMPGMLGVELLARSRDLYPETRRVLLTAQRGERVYSDPPPSPEQSVIGRESQARVRTVIDGMPERERELLLLQAEGYSYRDMADALDLNEASIGTLLARARQLFRAAYEEDP